MNTEELITIPLDIQEDAIIKVMGVGGGGCNAVNHMFNQGIQGVTLLVCNTDKQALGKSSVPAKLQLGPGLGAGGRPEKAQQYAEESRERIKEALSDGTQMLFLTAGMGGGTGTGASAIVASVAKEKGILTVGIVTIPFAFEGPIKLNKARLGIEALAEQVDALLVINNEKLKQIYPDLNLLNAFQKADDVVCNAARSIAEIITIPGYINTDFADVYNTLKDGNVAIMNVGVAEGENRITKAIQTALESPLINNDVHGAKRILLQFYCSTEHVIQMQEIDQINAFLKEVGDDVEVQWGASLDESLGDAVRVTIIATGYEVYDYIGEPTKSYKLEITGTQEQPETPEIPEEPENPKTPEQPEQPETPEQPEQPEEPEEPEQPEEPEIPEEPEQPKTPEEPEQPETPEEPETIEEPEQPKLEQEDGEIIFDVDTPSTPTTNQTSSLRSRFGWIRRR